MSEEIRSGIVYSFEMYPMMFSVQQFNNIGMSFRAHLEGASELRPTQCLHRVGASAAVPILVADWKVVSS